MRESWQQVLYSQCKRENTEEHNRRERKMGAKCSGSDEGAIAEGGSGTRIEE